MTFPLAVFPVIFPCLYYITHADLRYRHPIDPVLCLLTAIAVASTWNLLAGRDIQKPVEDPGRDGPNTKALSDVPT